MPEGRSPRSTRSGAARSTATRSHTKRSTTSRRRTGGPTAGATAAGRRGAGDGPAVGGEATANAGDITEFVALPRVTSLAVDPAGDRLVAAVQQPDADGGRYVSALWELDPKGSAEPRRLTFSARGESAPRFTTDGRLLFSSARPDPADPEASEQVPALWELPRFGEATVVADAPGGVTLAATASDGTLLLTSSVLAGGSLADDQQRRKNRKDRKVTAIWHAGMPIRYWDHEIDDVSPRLLLRRGDASAPDSDALIDLTPEADTVNLLNCSADLSSDGRWVATTWSQRAAGGELRTSIALIDTRAGRNRRSVRRKLLLRADTDANYTGPVFAPDGRWVVVTRSTVPTPTDTSYSELQIHPVAGGDPVRVQLGDLHPGEYRWAPDGTTLYVTGDLHSRGAVVAVDPATGRIRRTVADDAVYSSLSQTGDGTYLFALRSTVDSPPTPVRLTPRRSQPAVPIPAPGRIDELPGTLEWVESDVSDGAGGRVRVGGWLCTPRGASAKRPAPLMVWIHGGPHSSYNSWSWRWNPWIFVARGYAVLMPDPAMSTGYGDAALNRAWPRRPDLVWAEVEDLADHVLRRKTLDGKRTALLGASFGGFMTNWIAGHTQRFKAIVTHAGLYALDQQHPTTDAAASKVRVHLTPEQLPEWYAAFSPHHHVGKVTTPMLVTHGNKDYRVPVSEALRLWWDLVSRWPGKPQDMPHRFLQFTSENHWILSPGNAFVWNTAVADFVDRHVLGRDTPDQLPEQPAGS